MTDVPENFPSYTAYNAKQVLLHVDTMKLILKELQAEVEVPEDLSQEEGDQEWQQGRASV
jgi:hypothetical protein